MQRTFGDWPAEFWGFVIHTNCYAGNFENDLVSYLTGICNGFSFSDIKENNSRTYYGWLYYKDNNLLENNNPIENLSFDHVIPLHFDFEHDTSELSGFAHVWQTPNSLLPESKSDDKIYNSVALFMNRPPTKDEEQWFIERSKKFAELYKNNLQILKFELIRMRMEQTTSKTWHLA